MKVNLKNGRVNVEGSYHLCHRTAKEMRYGSLSTCLRGRFHIYISPYFVFAGAMQSAFEQAGIVFLDSDARGGIGVRLKIELPLFPNGESHATAGPGR